MHSQSTIVNALKRSIMLSKNPNLDINSISSDLLSKLNEMQMVDVVPVQIGTKENGFHNVVVKYVHRLS
eukprot:m.108483 g.108483  ORF g.108483 m.108483 type:complete len:69 (+) comp13967_c0_seq2:1622-1828(+)